MALQHPLNDDVVEVIARRFHLLADPTRIKLLDRLRDGEASVHELCGQIGTSQQNLSKHLGALVDANIVGRRRDGGVIRYRVIDEGVYRLCEDVCGGLERQLEALRDALVS